MESSGISTEANCIPFMPTIVKRIARGNKEKALLAKGVRSALIQKKNVRIRNLSLKGRSVLYPLSLLSIWHHGEALHAGLLKLSFTQMLPASPARKLHRHHGADWQPQVN